jgi:hypothetical protein
VEIRDNKAKEQLNLVPTDNKKHVSIVDRHKLITKTLWALDFIIAELEKAIK